MKPNTHHLTLAIAAAAIGFLPVAATAQLAIPGDGSDGVFAPTESVEVDLSLAVDGNWDDDNTANAGRGIYDRNQWAVVFKYQSVTIPEGVTVTFKNHPSRAPVVWLVQGDVTIIGPGNGPEAEPAVNLNGADGTYGDGKDVPTEPGPGGFRGGAASVLGNGAGLGIGGSASSLHANYNNVYGNPRIVPLIGGSGGNANGPSGSAGGGAILIACRGTVTLSGKIHANGGYRSGGYYGSGGGIRVIANLMEGNGELRATGGSSGSYTGRIRLETHSLSPDITTLPETIAVAPDPTPIIWPPSNAPKVRILSVDGVDAPAEPTANLTTGADIGIQNNGTVEVRLETTNFPIEGLVQVRRAAKFGGFVWHTATYVSGNNARAIWSATMPFASAFSTLQARATAP